MLAFIFFAFFSHHFWDMTAMTQICKISKKLLAKRYNAIGYCFKMFYLEQIYMRLDMELNMFEFNLVHGEFSITFALI